MTVSMLSIMSADVLLISQAPSVAQLMDHGEEFDMCFPDFNKALDVDYHSLLCTKLAALRMPSFVVS